MVKVKDQFVLPLLQWDWTGLDFLASLTCLSKKMNRLIVNQPYCNSVIKSLNSIYKKNLINCESIILWIQFNTIAEKLSKLIKIRNFQQMKHLL